MTNIFKIYLNGALDFWRQKCRNINTPVNDKRLFTLHFADDQVILAQNEMNIHYMVKRPVVTRIFFGECS